MFKLDIYVIYALLFKDQLERRNTQAMQLRDLLHLIGEKPLIPNVEKRIARVRGCSAHLLNVKTGLRNLDIVMRTGLPQELPQAAVDAIFRGIERSTARNNTILEWTPPLKVGQQMKLTLEDKQLLLADPLRRSIVVLRALPLFQGRIAYDCVKVLLTEPNNDEPSVYFGKCIAFISDQKSQHYVVLHWFDRREQVTGFDFLSNVPSFRLARIDKTSSYSVLPVDCIMNGAVMMPEPTPGFDPATPPPNTRYWALLSPREHEQYQLYFQQ